jgi:hypothetical protein
LQRLAFAKLDLFNVRITDHFKFFLGDRFPIGVADQLFLGLFLDLGFKTLQDHFPRSLAGPKSGNGGVLVIILLHLGEGLLHRFGFEFNPQ